MAKEPKDPNAPKKERKKPAPRKAWMIYTIVDSGNGPDLGEISVTKNAMDLVAAIQANPTTKFREVTPKK